MCFAVNLMEAMMMWQLVPRSLNVYMYERMAHFVGLFLMKIFTFFIQSWVISVLKISSYFMFTGCLWNVWRCPGLGFSRSSDRPESYKIHKEVELAPSRVLFQLTDRSSVGDRLKTNAQSNAKTDGQVRTEAYHQWGVTDEESYKNIFSLRQSVWLFATGLLL